MLTLLRFVGVGVEAIHVTAAGVKFAAEGVGVVAVTSLVTPVEVVDPTETVAEVAVIDDEGETINIPEPVHLLPRGP